jgi:hypothetical protein
VPDDSTFHLPGDLTGLTDSELASLAEQARAEFDAIYAAEGGPRPSDLARATELANALELIEGESGGRTEALAQLGALRERVHRDYDAASGSGAQPTAPDEPQPDAGTDGTDGSDSADDDPANAGADQDAPEPALTADARPTGGARTASRDLGGVDGPRRRLNPSLGAAQRRAPAPRVPERRSDFVITAAAPSAGMPIGTQFTDLDGLTRAVIGQARGMGVTNGNPNYVPLATIANRYDQVLGEQTSPDVVERTIRELTSRGRTGDAMEALVAAGGWCAPSEIRYDFFNIACEGGGIDLPTVGIDRGGVRFPISPSLADVFSNPSGLAPFTTTLTASSVPWLWTEADDISAVTGTGTKPCIRVPCPSFDEARLECFGICLTAGNLTDNAYPESTKNFLGLLMSAHAHAMNFRYIARIASLSTLSTPASGEGCTGAGVVAPLLGAVELAAIDYRTKYGMCDTDVLEVVLPTWSKGAVRSDLAKRTGQDLDSMAVTDAQIAAWFDARGVRVQFVQDYQVRAAGLPGQSGAVTAWPTTVEFLIYAAGTFVRGNGMSLDLGVVRDSTLNAKNDHTAAWSEECHLIARFGHEGRRYVVQICADGTTGAADLTACCL